MAYHDPNQTQVIIQKGMGDLWDQMHRPEKDLAELKEWLANAYPEVFKQYQCVKDITE